MTTNAITARFGGRDITFAIDRKHLPIFEAVHGSALLLYRKIASGAWMVEDLRAVLTFAAEGKAVAALPDFIMLAPAGAGFMLPKNEHVDAVLSERAPAQYAPLAQLILGAALLGIDDADATFSDEDEADAIAAD